MDAFTAAVLYRDPLAGRGTSDRRQGGGDCRLELLSFGQRNCVFDRGAEYIMLRTGRLLGEVKASKTQNPAKPQSLCDVGREASRRALRELETKRYPQTTPNSESELKRRRRHRAEPSQPLTL